MEINHKANLAIYGTEGSNIFVIIYAFYKGEQINIWTKSKPYKNEIKSENSGSKAIKIRRE